MPAFGSLKAAEKITATLPTGILTTDGCAAAVCDFGWVAGPCANTAEVATKRMNATAIIKSFRFMMCTSNGERKQAKGQELTYLRFALCPLLCTYSFGVNAAVAGFLLLNSAMNGLVISKDSEALTMP